MFSFPFAVSRVSGFLLGLFLFVVFRASRVLFQVSKVLRYHLNFKYLQFFLEGVLVPFRVPFRAFNM